MCPHWRPHRPFHFGICAFFYRLASQGHTFDHRSVAGILVLNGQRLWSLILRKHVIIAIAIVWTIKTIWCTFQVIKALIWCLKHWWYQLFWKPNPAGVYSSKWGGGLQSIHALDSNLSINNTCRRKQTSFHAKGLWCCFFPDHQIRYFLGANMTTNTRFRRRLFLLL